MPKYMFSLKVYILSSDNFCGKLFTVLSIRCNIKFFYFFISVHEKICVRCGKKFIVYPSGKYARQEECVYHWAKAWKRKGLFDRATVMDLCYKPYALSHAVFLQKQIETLFQEKEFIWL